MAAAAAAGRCDGAMPDEATRGSGQAVVRGRLSGGGLPQPLTAPGGLDPARAGQESAAESAGAEPEAAGA
jgi:hypothetical protein